MQILLILVPKFHTACKMRTTLNWLNLEWTVKLWSGQLTNQLKLCIMLCKVEEPAIVFTVSIMYCYYKNVNIAALKWHWLNMVVNVSMWCTYAKIFVSNSVPRRVPFWKPSFYFILFYFFDGDFMYCNCFTVSCSHENLPHSKLLHVKSIRKLQHRWSTERRCEKRRAGNKYLQ